MTRFIYGAVTLRQKNGDISYSFQKIIHENINYDYENINYDYEIMKLSNYEILTYINLSGATLLNALKHANGCQVHSKFSKA